MLESTARSEENGEAAYREWDGNDRVLHEMTASACKAMQRRRVLLVTGSQGKG